VSENPFSTRGPRPVSTDPRYTNTGSRPAVPGNTGRGPRRRTGAIMGVGATRGYSAVKWGVVREIVAAWVLTIPAAATVAGLYCLVSRALFGGIV